MDFEGTKFGRGPRELGGGVDLLNHYKLWQHHEYFCKSSLPLSISETRYLHNVVGDTEIRKGEGMELDQLFHNTSYVGNKHAHVHPFDLDVLWEAFQLREPALVDMPFAENGIPTAVSKLKGVSKNGENHKKHKQKDKEDEKDRKKHKIHHRDRDRDRDSGRDKEKSRNGHHDFGFEQSQKQQDKKRGNDGSEYLSGIQRCWKSEHKNSNISGMGMLKVAR